MEVKKINKKMTALTLIMLTAFPAIIGTLVVSANTTSTSSALSTITSKASTAIVTLENGTSGIATVKVDIDQSKVTQIVIITRTVIDKTTS